MAPRRRPPKPGTTRMDAAIDAMKTYGFTREIVMAKMRKLLKEYEGHYQLIEEDAYRVLLEALLDDQDNDNHHEPNQEQVALREASKENEIVDGSEMVQEGHAIVPPSGFIDITVCSSTPLTVIQPPPPQSQLPPPPPSSSPPPPPPPPSSPPPPSPPQPVLDAVLSLPPPPPLLAMYAALPVFESAQPRRRKPCHGWISNDDEEDLRFIIIPSLLNGQISPPESPPTQQETPLQQAQPELTGGGKTRPKRRSRWDLMPEDM